MYFLRWSFADEAQSDIDLSTTICNVKIMGSSPSGKLCCEVSILNFRREWSYHNMWQFNAKDLLGWWGRNISLISHPNCLVSLQSAFRKASTNRSVSPGFLNGWSIISSFRTDTDTLVSQNPTKKSDKHRYYSNYFTCTVFLRYSYKLIRESEIHKGILII